MKLLAIDTSTMTASVALVAGDRAAGSAVNVLGERDVDVTTHSDAVLQMVDQLLRDANLAVADLDGVAVGAGPGSFTGLRIAMSTAKGLCFAAGKPLFVASSLAALALDAVEQGLAGAGEVVVSLLDAKKGEVFAGAFAIREGLPLPVGDEVALAPDEVAGFVADAVQRAGGESPALLVGTGIAAYPDELAAAGRVESQARTTPSARSIARLAEPADVVNARPAYRRPPEIR